MDNAQVASYNDESDTNRPQVVWCRHTYHKVFRDASVMIILGDSNASYEDLRRKASKSHLCQL